MKFLFKALGVLFLLVALAFAWLVYSMREIGPGYADFLAELPHGYTIQRTSAHQITIWPGQDSSENGDAIPTKVVKLANDGTWLLAKQQHLQRRSPNDPDDTYELPVEGSYSYWILNMQTHERHGPLDETGFTAMRAELNVPTGLELQNIYAYRR